MKSPICLCWMLALCLAGWAACSRREEPAAPPPAATAPEVTATAAETPRTPKPAPALAETPAASAAGADLEKVAQSAAAFSDLIDALRTFAGEELEANPARLDLESFVRGKSDNELI